MVSSLSPHQNLEPCLHPTSTMIACIVSCYCLYRSTARIWQSFHLSPMRSSRHSRSAPLPPSLPPSLSFGIWNFQMCMTRFCDCVVGTAYIRHVNPFVPKHRCSPRVFPPYLSSTCFPRALLTMQLVRSGCWLLTTPLRCTTTPRLKRRLWCSSFSFSSSLSLSGWRSGVESNATDKRDLFDSLGPHICV